MATRWGCVGAGLVSGDFFTAINGNLPSDEHEVFIEKKKFSLKNSFFSVFICTLFHLRAHVLDDQMDTLSRNCNGKQLIKRLRLNEN